MGSKKGAVCEMKLLDIRDEKFNQPLFGANNISGAYPPAQKWKLTFNSGGIGTFLITFRNAIAGARERSSLPQTVTAEAEAVPMADVSYIVSHKLREFLVSPSWLTCLTAHLRVFPSFQIPLS